MNKRQVKELILHGEKTVYLLKTDCTAPSNQSQNQSNAKKNSKLNKNFMYKSMITKFLLQSLHGF